MINFMRKLNIATSLAVVAIINAGCPKPCIEANYSFSANSQISPDSDSIRVGDILYITSIFSTRLIDQTSGMAIDYSNATDIESTPSIAQLFTGNITPQGAVYDFKYYSQARMIYNATNIPSPETVHYS